MKKNFIFLIMVLNILSCLPPKEDFRDEPLKRQAKYLIVTADDYGASENINEGIRLAAENGIITAISAMTNFEESLARLKTISQQHLEIGIGVHLNITTGKPVTDPALIPSLVNKNGNFYTIDELLPHLNTISLKELKTELRAQIQLLADQGIQIDHLSNQHGIISLYDPFFGVMVELALEYHLPVRSPAIASVKFPDLFPDSHMAEQAEKTFKKFVISYPLKAISYASDFHARKFVKYTNRLTYAGITYPDLLIDYFYGNPTETNLTFILNHLPPGINEIVLHLGTQDRQQEYPSGLDLDYFSNREQELNTLNNYHFNDHLHQMAIKKINYSEIKRIATFHVSYQTD